MQRILNLEFRNFKSSFTRILFLLLASFFLVFYKRWGEAGGSKFSLPPSEGEIWTIKKWRWQYGGGAGLLERGVSTFQITLYIWRKNFFFVTIILWKKIILGCLKLNLCVCVWKISGSDLDSCLRESVENCLKYRKKAWNK